MEKENKKHWGLSKEKEVATKSRHSGPMSLTAATRWSIRRLEADSLQTSTTEQLSSSTGDVSSAKRVASIDKLVHQEPRTLLAYARKKLKRPYATTNPPVATKKVKIIQENDRDVIEIFEHDFQPCHMKKAQVHAEVDVAPLFSPPDEVSGNGNTPNEEPNIALTEIREAGKHLDEDSDDVEIVSSASFAHHYRVKKEYRSLIEKIVKKHGDILTNHTLHSHAACSFYLEMVCVIIRKLQKSTFEDIEEEELDNMLCELADAEISGLQVEWLREKIKEIKGAKNEVKSLIKENRDRVNREIKEVKMDLQMDEMILRAKQIRVEELQGKIKALQDNVNMMHGEIATILEKKSLLVMKLNELETDSKELDDTILDTRTKVHSLYHRSLVDGLL